MQEATHNEEYDLKRAVAQEVTVAVATAAKRRRLSVEERVAIVEGIHGKNVLDPDSMDSGERSAKLLQTLAEYLESCGGQQSLVDGWYTKTEYRNQGATTGTYDSYFVSPQGKRFRSRAEIARYFALEAAPAPRGPGKSAEAKRAQPEKDGIDNLPHGKGLLFQNDGDIATVEGPFDGHVIRSLVKCRDFQMVPFTVGKLAGKFELWLNENGRYEDTLNEVATAKLGAQSSGGKLYGNVLVVRSGTVP